MAEKSLKSKVFLLYTEQENCSWLQYLMDEFCRIEHADFSIEVHQIEADREKNEKALYYLKNPNSDVYHCEHSKCKISRDSQLISIEGFQITEKSLNKEDRLIKYDLFWNSFYYLSRLHEYELSLKQISVKSYSFKTQMPNNFDWETPHVNLMFKVFKKALLSRFSTCSFLTEKKASMELSHDLDYIDKTLVLILKQSVFNLYNSLIKKDSKKLVKTFRFITKKANYWNFDYWQGIEHEYQKKSIFYVYSKVNSGLRELILDPSYDVNKNQKLKNKLKKMNDDGWEIGLHGSFFSHLSFELLKKEKEQLEFVLDLEITKNRQHWLCFDETKTPFYHEKLFKADATIGWNDRIGFRSGVASKYRPFNHQSQCAFNHFETPQVIMDSNIYDYGSGKEIEILKNSIALLNLCKDIKNTEFSISWHPRTSSSDYHWSSGYESILNEFY